MGGGHDGSSRREGVGGRAGGGGHDQPVGGVGGEELTVHLHRQPDGVAHGRLLDDRFVEGQVLGSLAIGSLHLHRQEHPDLDGALSGEEALQGGKGARWFDVGEVAHLPHVHADDRHPGGRDQLDGAQHGAVAAQADGQVQARAELCFVAAVLRQPGQLGVVPREAHLVAALSQPRSGGRGLARRPARAGGGERTRWRPSAASGLGQRQRHVLRGGGDRSLGMGSSVEEELHIAVCTGEGRRHGAHDGGSEALQRGNHLAEHPLATRGDP